MATRKITITVPAEPVEVESVTERVTARGLSGYTADGRGAASRIGPHHRHGRLA
ncbi:hypothetical protein ACPCAG_10570 [Streptomyces pseudogriseolus]|uniref:hypothetical protein n=1 Tax=Streptomyces pseudogriseolus TaxID=36817 RepID=UPI003FA2BC41